MHLLKWVFLVISDRNLDLKSLHINHALNNFYETEFQTQGPGLYQIFPVIVIVVSAMVTFQFCPKLRNKHCIEHYDYDYDRKKQIHCPSFRLVLGWPAILKISTIRLKYPTFVGAFFVFLQNKTNTKFDFLIQILASTLKT